MCSGARQAPHSKPSEHTRFGTFRASPTYRGRLALEPLQRIDGGSECIFLSILQFVCRYASDYSSLQAMILADLLRTQCGGDAQENNDISSRYRTFRQKANIL